MIPIDIFRAIILPILFSTFSVIADTLSSGRGGNKDRTMKITYNDRAGKIRALETDPSDLLELKTRYPYMASVEKVEILTSPKWLERSSLSVNLCILALTADATAFFSTKRDELQLTETIAVFFFVHLFILISVLKCREIAQQTEDSDKKTRYELFALLGLAVPAVFIAFFFLQEAL